MYQNSFWRLKLIPERYFSQLARPIWEAIFVVFILIYFLLVELLNISWTTILLAIALFNMFMSLRWNRARTQGNYCLQSSFLQDPCSLLCAYATKTFQLFYYDTVMRVYGYDITAVHYWILRWRHNFLLTDWYHNISKFLWYYGFQY